MYLEKAKGLTIWNGRSILEHFVHDARDFFWGLHSLVKLCLSIALLFFPHNGNPKFYYITAMMKLQKLFRILTMEPKSNKNVPMYLARRAQPAQHNVRTIIPCIKQCKTLIFTERLPVTCSNGHSLQHRLYENVLRVCLVVDSNTPQLTCRSFAIH